MLLIGLAGSAHQAWSANLYTTVSDMFPKSAVASVIGIGGMAGSAGGILFPVYCGRVLDHYKLANVTAGYAHPVGISRLHVPGGLCAATTFVRRASSRFNLRSSRVKGFKTYE